MPRTLQLTVLIIVLICTTMSLASANPFSTSSWILGGSPGSRIIQGPVYGMLTCQHSKDNWSSGALIGNEYPVLTVYPRDLVIKGEFTAETVNWKDARLQCSHQTETGQVAREIPLNGARDRGDIVTLKLTPEDLILGQLNFFTLTLGDKGSFRPYMNLPFAGELGKRPIYNTSTVTFVLNVLDPDSYGFTPEHFPAIPELGLSQREVFLLYTEPEWIPSLPSWMIDTVYQQVPEIGITDLSTSTVSQGITRTYPQITQSVKVPVRIIENESLYVEILESNISLGLDGRVITIDAPVDVFKHWCFLPAQEDLLIEHQKLSGTANRLNIPWDPGMTFEVSVRFDNGSFGHARMLVQVKEEEVR